MITIKKCTVNELNYIAVVSLYSGSDVSIPPFSPTSPVLTMTSTATAVKGIGTLVAQNRDGKNFIGTLHSMF